MPHQCTKCSKIYPDAAEELLKGCECGSRFFYYIRKEKYEELQNEVKQVLEELDRADKDHIEKDIRELTGLDKNPDEPVILDLESVRVIKPGKFEIDIVNLMNKNRPLIYKLEEGKYIIDLATSLKVDKEKVDKKIRDPYVEIGDKEEKEPYVIEWGDDVDGKGEEESKEELDEREGEEESKEELDEREGEENEEIRDVEEKDDRDRNDEDDESEDKGDDEEDKENSEEENKEKVRELE